MTHLGPSLAGLDITTASVTVDPALAAADPAMMAMAARAFLSAAHQVRGAGQASWKASTELSANWWGKGRQGFDAASSKANSRARLGADALANASAALMTLSAEIAAAKAMAEKAQTLAAGSAQAAVVLQSAYASSSQQAVRDLPPNATLEQALAARAPTVSQVVQANDISSEAAQATQLMGQANLLARQAWDKAAVAFEAITATSPTAKAAMLSSAADGAHRRARVSADQVKIVTQADGRRVYSFDGGLAIPVDLPGVHRLVEDIKAYMPRFLAGNHAALQVPAGLSAQGMWFLAASFYVTTTMREVPQELRNVFFTARFSATTMRELIGAGLAGGAMVGGAAYLVRQPELFQNLFGKRILVAADGSPSVNEAARSDPATSGGIPTTANQVTAAQTDQANQTLGTGTGTSAILPTPKVDNPKLQNLVNDLYKGTSNPNRVGAGTTADAVRNERESGEPTGGTFHTQKAQQYSAALNKLLKTGGLNQYDRLVAQSLRDDLQSSLGKKP